MLKNFAGKIISIDLNNKSYELIDDYNVKDLMHDEGILFLTGAMTGSNIATGGRYNILAKSLKTGELSVSNTGGLWGRRLVYSGFKGVLIRGSADSPVHVLIDGRSEDEKIKVEDAKGLWGKGSKEVNKCLKDIYGKDSSSIYIGPAGEREILPSCLISDGTTAAGRDSFGAIFGRKNLKALTVISNSTADVDRDVMKDKLQTDYKDFEGEKYILEALIDSLGRDISDEVFDGRVAEALAEGINPGCYSCPVMCKKGLAKKKDYQDHKYFWNFNKEESDIYNKRANDLANDMGLDSIGLVNYINWAVETGKSSYDLDWNNGDKILKFIKGLLSDENEIAKLNEYVSEMGKASEAKIVKSTSQIVKRKNDLSDLIDYMGLCIFSNAKMSADSYRILYNVVTGSNLTLNEFINLKVF